MVTTVGLQRMASILAANNFITHMAVGDDDTAENVADLALGNELHRVALDNIAQSDQVCWGVGTVTASDIGVGSYSIKEYGFFDAGSGGNMLCRVVLDTAVVITGAQKFIGAWGEVNR